MIPKQLPLGLKSWGGRRKGAGRKPKGDRAGVSHAARPALSQRTPVHVTLRVRDHVYNLRSKRCFRVIEAALYFGGERFGLRVVHFSVQGNHLHLIVEAEDAGCLSRGLKGLSVRIARGLNRVMKKSGRVFADRYHARILKSPNETRRALSYVLHNFRKHARERGQVFPRAFVDPYSSAALLKRSRGPVPLARPRSWMLRTSCPPSLLVRAR